MNDIMIPLGLLMLCRTSYLKNSDDLPNEYYASPIKIPSEII